MISTQDLLAAAKAGAGIPSNYRLARVLNVTEQTVSNWQNGRRWPDDPMALRLADMGHLDPAEVLVSIYAERAKAGPMKEIWQRVASYVHDSAHGALTALVGTAVIVSALFAASPDAAASTLTRPADQQSADCILCKLRRALRRLGQAARDLIPAPSGSQPAFA